MIRVSIFLISPLEIPKPVLAPIGKNYKRSPQSLCVSPGLLFGVVGIKFFTFCFKKHAEDLVPRDYLSTGNQCALLLEIFCLKQNLAFIKKIPATCFRCALSNENPRECFVQWLAGID